MIGIRHKVSDAVIYWTEGPLAGGDICNMDLREANLDGMNLHGADLHGTNFEDASLEKADLRGTNLNKANFHGASLVGADLSHCSAINTNFEEADLSYTTFRGAWLGIPRFDGANLYQAELMWARGYFLRLIGSRHPIIAFNEHNVLVGCLQAPLEWWIKNYRHAGIQNGYSPEAIKEYRRYLSCIKKLFLKGDRDNGTKK